MKINNLDYSEKRAKSMLFIISPLSNQKQAPDDNNRFAFYFVDLLKIGTESESQGGADFSLGLTKQKKITIKSQPPFDKMDSLSRQIYPGKLKAEIVDIVFQDAFA